MPVNHNVEKIGEGINVRMALMASWFKELSHPEMVEQIAAYGFSAFEELGAGKWEDKEAVKAKCQELGVSVGAISAGGAKIAGDGPVNPAFHDTFVANVKDAISEAKAIGTNILLGLTGAQRFDMTVEQQMENVAACARRCAPMLEDAGMTLVFETLNVKVNHPGYMLVTSKQGSELSQMVGSPSVKFLFDIYHQQISEGDVCRNIQAYINDIGHFHFADNPGRHEPGTGELNYKSIFKTIVATGYNGIVSCEFTKTPDITVEQLLRILADTARW